MSGKDQLKKIRAREIEIGLPMVDTQISMMITAGMSREEAEKEAIREFNEMHKEVYGTTNYKKGGLVKKKTKKTDKLAKRGYGAVIK